MIDCSSVDVTNDKVEDKWHPNPTDGQSNHDVDIE